MRTSTGPADGVLYEVIKSPAAYVEAYNAQMGNPSNRLRVRAVTDMLRRVGPGVRRVIDVASGGGAYTSPARAVLGEGVRFFPVDRQRACVTGYRLNHPAARPALADVTALPFAKGAFDLALCLDIIEHLDDDVAFLRGIEQLLVPGGWVVISTENRRSIEHLLGLARSAVTGKTWRGWDPTHVRFYDGASLEGLLTAAGFELVAIDGTYYWPFHFPARLASWPFERLGFPNLARLIYHAVSAPGYALNAIFEAGSQMPGLRTLGWGIIALGRRRSASS